MTFPEPLASLIAPLAALQCLLDRLAHRASLSAGLRQVLGKPRFTVDLDAMFLASIKDIDRILAMAKEEGIEPRTDKVAEFAKKSRVLLLRHTVSRVNINISLGILPFEEEVVARNIVYDAGALSVRLPTPEEV